MQQVIEEDQPSPPSEERVGVDHPKIKTFDHRKTSATEPEDSQSDDVAIVDADDSDQ